MGRLRIACVAAIIGLLLTAPLALAALPPGGTFTDDDGSIFEAAIEAIAAEGITLGCNPPANDRYCPDDSVTRGQMAVFLVRAFGYTDNGGGDLFDDDDGLFYENAADRLKTAGVTIGCNPPVNDRYCGERAVTRGEMAAFFARALSLPVFTGPDRFVDDNASTFEGAIERLAQAAITLGCNPPTNNRFCPNDLRLARTDGRLPQPSARPQPHHPTTAFPQPMRFLFRLASRFSRRWMPIRLGRCLSSKPVFTDGRRLAPRINQRFVGEPGAILDGGYVAEFAFQGGGDGVIIEGLVIRRYSNPLQSGVLRTSAGATDWIVRNNEITDNDGAAIYANPGGRSATTAPPQR